MRAANDNRMYPPEWCSADTAAYLLDIGASTFRSYVSRGLLPAGVMRGGSMRWRRQAVIDAWGGDARPQAHAQRSRDEDEHDVDAAIIASIMKHGPATKTRR